MFKKQTYTKNCDILSRSLSQSGWEASLRWLPLPLFLFCFFLIWLCSFFIAVCRLLWLWQAGDTPHGIAWPVLAMASLVEHRLWGVHGLQ